MKAANRYQLTATTQVHMTMIWAFIKREWNDEIGDIYIKFHLSLRLRGVCCLLTILRFLWSLDEWSERRAAQQCQGVLCVSMETRARVPLS